MPAFCTHCGNKLKDGANYCEQCGKAVGADAPSPAPASSGFKNEPLPDNVIALLCYALGLISGIILLNLDPYRNDPKLRFHAWQSIYFGGLWLALPILQRVVVVGMVSFWATMGLLHLLFFIVWIVLMVKSDNGEIWKLPVLGNLAQQRANATN